MNMIDERTTTPGRRTRIGRRDRVTACAALAAVMLAWAGVGAAQPAAGALAAKVNGVGISQDRFERSVDAFLRQRGLDATAMRDSVEYGQLRTQVLDILIAQELLWQEARRKGVSVPDEEVTAAIEQIRTSMSETEYLARIEQAGFDAESFAEDMRQRLSTRRFVETEINAGMSVSDAEVSEFYQANRARMMSPEQVRARHLLISVAPDADQPTRDAARERIEALLTQARGEADFAALAGEHSEGPSAARGGDLGFFTREQMVKPFADAAFALEPGELSGVVQTRFGYHIIKLEERRVAQPLSEAEVSPRIRQHLMSAKSQQALEAFVQTLRERGEIELLAPR